MLKENLAPKVNPTINMMIMLIIEKDRTASILPIESFQGCTGIDFNFKKRPLCLSSEILAARLVIPEIIKEKVIIDMVIWPLASPAYASGTSLRKTKTPRNNQSMGQAITQKSADMLIRLSLIPLIKVAEI
ncbi:MAG: hypothetical protein A2Z35_03615 [Actinobacteria bacterium RBG_19FT_COMBO_36_27]|nr:MAG: hypothetical protein A2Z35_03615 [Actinobacteria bacterium RBG_19FT_COMBO_36_27]